jgi:hypothetical protein
LPHRAKAQRGAAVSPGKEFVKCRLQAIEILGVVVTLEGHPDETLFSALANRNLDSIFADGSRVPCFS